MKTLLVTGGAGFIGGNFVLNALAGDAPWRIVNLDLLTYAGNLDTLSSLDQNPAHRFVHGDIADQGLVSELLKSHRPDAIINFAAESHVDRSIDGPAVFVQTNVVGTLNLLQCALTHWRSLEAPAAEQFRFLHVSTDEVYGSLGPTGLFTEKTAYAPNSPYAASKASADHLVRAYQHTYGLPTLTSNCSNNYGPYQFPEKLIPLMILNAVAGLPLPVYGDGQQVRDWLFVRDHVSAIMTILAGGRAGETYNIGGNCERTNLQVVKAICEAVDARRQSPGIKSSSLITRVADRPGHDRRYAIDCSKLTGELGWSPAVSFEQGLELTVDWYFSNPDWIKRVQDGSYQGQRLGLLEAGA
jgi:dTDP-glucose 4,6-dehydratase